MQGGCLKDAKGVLDMNNRKHQGRGERDVLDNLNEGVSCNCFIRGGTLTDDWGGRLFARGTQQTVLLIHTTCYSDYDMDYFVVMSNA